MISDWDNLRVFLALAEEGSLTFANLNGCDLTRANLTSASLHGADLTKANLTSAITKDAIFKNAKLIGTIGYKP